MNIQNKNISEIKPYSNNAKKHDKKQIKKVSESIKRFGFSQPLVVDKNNELIIGHCRLEASKKLKLKEVPVLIMEDLSEQEVKALRLADNKLNESEWDMDLVNIELDELDIDLKDIIDFEVISPDDFDTDFSLREGDKEPFQQITFTLADDQAEEIKKILADVKKTDEYKHVETFGNENSNGNALYCLILQNGQS